jgi:3-oxoacyl-[acyl-carrier-protein] synthase-1
MTNVTKKIVITGAGAICGAGQSPAEIVARLARGETAVAPIQNWNASSSPCQVAAEVADYNGGKLLGDRKLLKLVRRSDVFGIYAGEQAIAQAGLNTWRQALTEADALDYADQTGCYVGSGGGAFEVNYDYFPLMSETGDSLHKFGCELPNMVNPMWLLRSLPNNVLCHVSIRNQLKGVNGCITHHTTSGLLAVIEGAWAIREKQADRVISIAHDAPIEPQTVLYLHQVGLLATEHLRPFDVQHNGCVLGEGAGALVLESEASAQERGAVVLGEYLGGGDAVEGESLFDVRADGDGEIRAIELALKDAGLQSSDIGMIVAHGNGTPGSDESEAFALQHVFGALMPPVTSTKWAVGHLFGAAGMLDITFGLECARQQLVPGVANLKQLAPGCKGLNVSSENRKTTSDIVMILARGFAGTNAAVILRAYH